MRRALLASVALHGALLGGSIALASGAPPAHEEIIAEFHWRPQRASEPAGSPAAPPDLRESVEQASAPAVTPPPFEPPAQPVDTQGVEQIASQLEPPPKPPAVLRAPRPQPPTELLLQPRAALRPLPPRDPAPRMATPPAPAMAQVDAVPLDAENAPPVYPASARRRGLEGEVWLEVRIGRDGRPQRVDLHRPCRHAELNREALRAVRGWRFRPARRNGQVVESVLRFPIIFRLTDGTAAPNASRLGA
jgi:protein TonB